MQTSRDKILAAIAADKKQLRYWNKTSPTTVALSNYALFQFGAQPAAGTYPGAALAKTAITGGSSPSITGGILAFTDPTAPDKSFLTFGNVHGQTANAVGRLKFVDYLVCYQGFNANSGSAQNTTGGAGAGGSDIPAGRGGNDNTFLIFDVQTAFGATAGVTVVCTYTNQSLTGSRTSQTTTLIASAPQGQIPYTPFFIPLQAGDTGIASLQTVDLSGTGTGAGTFAAVICREIAEVDVLASSVGSLLFGEVRWAVDPLRFPRIYTGTAVSWIWIPSSAVTTPSLGGSLELVAVDLTS